MMHLPVVDLREAAVRTYTTLYICIPVVDLREAAVGTYTTMHVRVLDLREAAVGTYTTMHVPVVDLGEAAVHDSLGLPEHDVGVGVRYGALEHSILSLSHCCVGRAFQHGSQT